MASRVFAVTVKQDSSRGIHIRAENTESGAVKNWWVPWVFRDMLSKWMRASKPLTEAIDFFFGRLDD